MNMNYEYRIYEVSSQYRQGKVLKDYKNYNNAIAYMKKSIFRFIKEIKIIKK